MVTLVCTDWVCFHKYVMLFIRKIFKNHPKIRCWISLLCLWITFVLNIVIIFIIVFVHYVVSIFFRLFYIRFCGYVDKQLNTEALGTYGTSHGCKLFSFIYAWMTQSSSVIIAVALVIIQFMYTVMNIYNGV